MRSPPLVILLLIALALTLAPANWAQQKPLTQDQVQGLVRSGLGDETGAKAIEQRGIDFAPGEDFLQSLQAAGASEAFLKALRAAKPPEVASAKKPLYQVQVFALLMGEVPSHRVTMLVQERGIDFEPTDDYLQEVRLAGGEDELTRALQSAKVTKPATVDPAAQARQAEVRRHAASGAEFFQKDRYADAEAEYRAAIRLDPQNAGLHVGLSRALNRQRRTDEALAEELEALRLNPNNDAAHVDLGNALGRKGDTDGMIAEERKALRLNPDNESAHFSLGLALIGNDWDGAISEFREALRLNPNNESAHVELGLALEGKGDWDGATAEYREALRLNPNHGVAHFCLGIALERKGDWRGALEEYRAAYTFDPKDVTYKQHYERLMRRMNK